MAESKLADDGVFDNGERVFSKMNAPSQADFAQSGNLMAIEKLNQYTPFASNIALTTDGKIVTWGNTSVYSNGMVGNSVRGLAEVPIPHAAGAKVVEFGGIGETCVVLYDNGDLFGWGNGVYDNIMTGDTRFPQIIATDVDEVFLPRDVSYHVNAYTIYIRKGTRYYFKGRGNEQNGGNRSGDGTAAGSGNHADWTEITYPPGTIKKLFNMGSHYGITVIQTTDNKIWMVGNNSDGQCGVGSYSNLNSWTQCTSSLPEKPIKEIRYADTQYSDRAYALLVTWIVFEDGELYSAGDNTWGQLGTGDTTKRNTFTRVMTGVDKLQKGGGGPCALFAMRQPATVGINGGTDTRTYYKEYYVWGYNSHGQCGVGNATTPCHPTQVVQDTFDIYANMHGHTYDWECSNFRHNTDGMLQATGRGHYYSNGRGVNGQVNSWVDTYMVSQNIKDVRSYGYSKGQYVLCLLDDGSMYAWGYGGRRNCAGMYDIYDGSVPTPTRMV